MSTEDAVKNYRPIEATCPPDVWQRVGGEVRRLVTNAGVGTSARQVRPYLAAVAGLLAWLEAEGYDTDPELALTGESIEAYAGTLTHHQATLRSRLRRISTGNGFDPTPGAPTQFRQRQYQPPYTTAELAALWAYGQALSRRHRQIRACAVVALGSCCGLRVADMRGVTADDVHTHPGAGLWVQTNGRCVPVRPEYKSWLRWVIRQQPTGPLVGPATGVNGLNRVAMWVRNSPGVPDLSVFRLRSTWLCHHITTATPASDLMAWAALTKFGALDGYRPFLPAKAPTCDRDW